MNWMGGRQVAVLIAGLAAATQALPYPNCEDNPSAAAVFLAERITSGVKEELDSVYDHYFVRALQKQMERASFLELSRGVGPASPQAPRPFLMKPKVREVDQLAVKAFTRLAGAAAGVTVGVVRGRSSGITDLLMTLQCQDGQWKLTGISVGVPERR